MTDQLAKTSEATTPSIDTAQPIETAKPVQVKPKFRIEKIDDATARKIDTTQSVTVINIDMLRQQKDELESEIAVKQKMLDDVTEVVTAFDAAAEPAKEATEVDEQAEAQTV